MISLEQNIKELQLFNEWFGVNAIINVLSNLEAGTISLDVIGSLRLSLSTMLDDKTNDDIKSGNVSLADAIYNTLVALTEFAPVNDIDSESKKYLDTSLHTEIEPEDSFADSMGYLHDINSLAQWLKHSPRGRNKHSVLDSDFRERDLIRILEMCRDKNIDFSKQDEVLGDLGDFDTLNMPPHLLTHLFRVMGSIQYRLSYTLRRNELLPRYVFFENFQGNAYVTQSSEPQNSLPQSRITLQSFCRQQSQSRMQLELDRFNNPDKVLAYEFIYGKCIYDLLISQYSNDDFELKITSGLSLSQSLRNALFAISINEQTFGVLKFPNGNLYDNKFKIRGNAETIQNHLPNIINMIKTLEGDQVFSSEIEEEIRNFIPSALNDRKLTLYQLKKEAARVLRLEQKSLKLLKDHTKTAPLDPEKSQIVLYRKNKN